MKNKIPAGYKPLLDKMGKNLNEEELNILQGMVNGTVTDPEIMKKLFKKMLGGLNRWEKMKLFGLFSYLSTKGK